jgi:hypothetical protein
MRYSASERVEIIRRVELAEQLIRSLRRLARAAMPVGSVQDLSHFWSVARSG